MSKASTNTTTPRNTCDISKGEEHFCGRHKYHHTTKLNGIEVYKVYMVDKVQNDTPSTVLETNTTNTSNTTQKQKGSNS